MPSYRINTSQGSFVVNANRQPTPQEVQGMVENKQVPFLERLGGSLKQSASDVRTEKVAPLLSGASNLAFGLPRKAISELEKRQTPIPLTPPGLPINVSVPIPKGTEEFLFPEQKTLSGKTARVAADLTGFLRGGAMRTGQKVAGAIPAGAKTKEAVKLGTAGFLQTPGAFNEDDFLNLDERALQGLVAAASVPAAVGAGKLFGAGGRVIKRGFQTAKKNIASVKQSLGRHGDALKQSDFVRSTLAPKANQLFASAKETFNPAFQKFAKMKLRLDDAVVKHIAAKKPATVDAIAAKFNNNPTTILNSVDSIIDKRAREVGKLYDSALKGKNFRIEPRSTVRVAQTNMKSLGLMDERGRLTALADEFGTSPAIRLQRQFVQSLGETGLGTAKGATKGTINKQQFNFFRDQIGRAYRGASPSEKRMLKMMSDALHKDAEKAGFTGITKARDAFSKQLSVNDARESINESKINRVFNLGKKDVQTFRDLEQKLGVKILDPSKDLAASNAFNKALRSQKIDETTIGENEFFARVLDSALDPKKTQSVKSAMAEALGGGKDLDLLFNDLSSFRMLNEAKRFATRAAATGGLIGSGLAAGVALE